MIHPSTGNLPRLMHWAKTRRCAFLLGMTGSVAILLAGCSSPRPYYYWGSYQDQLYDHFLQRTTPDVQLLALEKDKIQAEQNNQHLPPGYYAFMGLLYAETGQIGKAETCFVAEKTLFPEAEPYMNFLLKTPDKAKNAEHMAAQNTAIENRNNP